MFPLEPGAINRVMADQPISHRSIALRHASIHGRPGLWGDDPARPSSVVWLRAGDDGGWEAFASGDPEPALDWIESEVGGAVVALLAPEFWEDAIRRRGGLVEAATIRTFLDFDLMMLPRFSWQALALTRKDASAFESITPRWALRSWGDFGSLIDRGLAIGLHSVDRLVSVAWTYESDLVHDKIGVATLPNFRHLGLGRRVGSALLERIVKDRRKAPIWVTSSENTASLGLARSLGFANPVDETLVRWTPGRG